MRPVLEYRIVAWSTAAKSSKSDELIINVYLGQSVHTLNIGKGNGADMEMS